MRWSYPQVGIVTTVRHEKPHQGRAVQHFLPRGPFAILPLTGNRSCITWTEEASRAREILALDDAGFLAEVEKRFGYRLGADRAGGAARRPGRSTCIWPAPWWRIASRWSAMPRTACTRSRGRV